jgi:hypothetical protein
VKITALAALLLALPLVAADDNKPFSPEMQIKLLKAQRQIQASQLQMADLQRQYEQAAALIKQLQAEMEGDCATAAKAANVDLTKYTCDLDKLVFLPRPDKKEPAK